MKRILLVFFLGLAQFTFAFAANGNVAVTMQAFKVVATAKGTELVRTDEIQPGDTIEYQVTYQNTSGTPARNVGATLPVPAGGIVYVPNSATPAVVMATLDGERFDHVPLRRSVVRDGRNVIETVPVAEYRALRWMLGELAAGQSVTVKSRMQLPASTTSNKQ